MDTVLTVGVVGAQATFLMSRMFGNMNTLEKRTTGATTGIKIVETRVEIRTKNGTERNIRSEAEAALGRMAGIEIGRGGLGTYMGGVEAQDDIVAGMTTEWQRCCSEQAFWNTGK